MANENDTVEHVCEELTIDGKAWFANRILVAHKRELAAKDAERLTISANYESVIAAKDRIIEAKDAEIARLKSKIEEYERQPEMMADVATEALEVLKSQDAEIAKRDALIKELADSLDNYPCHNCKHGSDRCEWCDRMKEFDALIAKAREVIFK